jgi:hypothetical protein
MKSSQFVYGSTRGSPKKSDDNNEISHPFEGVAYIRFLPRLVKQLPRAMAYSNEIGESFRYVTHPWFVASTYVFAGIYIMGDTAIKVGHQMGNDMKFNKMAQYQLIDTSLFHIFASMVIPSVTIHTAVKMTKTICNSMNTSYRTSRIAPIVVGLGMIPLIVGPIDHSVEYLLDTYVRPLYPMDVSKMLIK